MVLHKPMQRPRADMTRDFFDEPAYLSIVRPDEQKFLSLPDCTAIFGKQHVVKDGPCTGIKFISFLRPADGFNHESFLGYWRSNHAPLVEEVEPFWKHIRRYVQNHGIPELYRGLSAEGRPAPFLRCRRNLVRFGGEPRGGFQRARIFGEGSAGRRQIHQEANHAVHHRGASGEDARGHDVLDRLAGGQFSVIADRKNPARRPRENLLSRLPLSGASRRS